MGGALGIKTRPHLWNPPMINGVHPAFMDTWHYHDSQVCMAE